MNLLVEVTWDNGIDGDDIISIGEAEDESQESILKVANRYFGGNVEIVEKNERKYLKTKKGILCFCLEHEY